MITGRLDTVSFADKIELVVTCSVNQIYLHFLILFFLIIIFIKIIRENLSDFDDLVILGMMATFLVDYDK